MTEFAIRAKNLRKVYRLYTKPHYRVLDMFGLLRNQAAYSEHVAIDDVSLEMRRGEKVAIIGRNGAGKSTLLRLITQAIPPTSGILEVSGNTHVLLQLGTGFHPDFTGRENVYAYLAYQGISGAEADAKFHEIVEFAELEEYIHQPLKTYSTGMGVRLMFATSTAIRPEILVLDEVLGVGDAYFAQKSFHRIRALCEGEGTTVLLVSHDLYSAAKLCERVIWIDRGRVLMDRDAPTAIKAYEDSIREQEESRLRQKRRQTIDQMGLVAQRAIASRVTLEIRARENRPQPVAVYFSKITLCSGDVPLTSLPLTSLAPADPQMTHLDRENTCWGEPEMWHGQQSRPMLNFGSSFHKVTGTFVVPGELSAADSKQLSVKCDYWSAEPCQLSLRAFVDDQEFALGELPASQGQWTEHRAAWPTEVMALAERPLPEINTTGVCGTNLITVRDARCLNEQGEQTHLFGWGEPFEFQICYQIVKPELREHAQIMVIVHREGVQDVCRFLTRDLLFDYASQPTGTVQMRVPRLMLANGNYTLSIMIAQEGYYDREQTVFYTINPGVYNCLSRVVDFTVHGAGLAVHGTVAMGDADWHQAPKVDDAVYLRQLTAA